MLFDILELVAGLVMDLLRFVYGLLEKTLGVTLALLSFLFSLLWPVVQFLLNLLFGWLKKIIDDIIKALMLLEYEKLLKKKAKLAESLEKDGETLGELVGISEEFPLQGVKVVFKVLLERNDVFLLRLALFCLLEGKKKIIVIA